MNIEFNKFEPQTISKETWNKYHNFRKLRHEETSADDPFQPNEIVEKSIIQDYKSDQIEMLRYFIIDSDLKKELNQIGSLGLATFTEKNPSYQGNKHIAQFDLALLPEYRKKGIGTKAIAEIIGYLKERNITLIICSTTEKDGKEFLQHIGASLALAGKENRLALKDVDWSMINNWVTEGERLNPETKILQFTRIPDELIEQYAPFYTEVMNQQPFDDLEIDKLIFTPATLRKREEEFQELGFTDYTMVTIEKTGEISGMTEMIRMPAKDKMLNQGLTGVKDNQRGRKLGKWLKAAMLLEMKEKFPQVTTITTGNADSNAPMLSINHRLGFKPHKESEMGQIEFSKLESYITQKLLILH